MIWPAIGAVLASATAVVTSFLPWLGFRSDLGIPWSFTGTGRVVVAGHAFSDASNHYSDILGDGLRDQGIATALLAAAAMVAIIVGFVWRSVVPVAIAATALIATTVITAAVWIRPPLLAGDLLPQIGASSMPAEIFDVRSGLVVTCVAAAIAAALVLLRIRQSWPALFAAVIGGGAIGALALVIAAAV